MIHYTRAARRFARGSRSCADERLLEREHYLLFVELKSDCAALDRNDLGATYDVADENGFAIDNGGGSSIKNDSLDPHLSRVFATAGFGLVGGGLRLARFPCGHVDKLARCTHRLLDGCDVGHNPRTSGQDRTAEPCGENLILLDGFLVVAGVRLANQPKQRPRSCHYARNDLFAFVQVGMMPKDFGGDYGKNRENHHGKS
jgi:hypothetical protein